MPAPAVPREPLHGRGKVRTADGGPVVGAGSCGTQREYGAVAPEGMDRPWRSPCRRRKVRHPAGAPVAAADLPGLAGKAGGGRLVPLAVVWPLPAGVGRVEAGRRKLGATALRWSFGTGARHE